MLATGRGFYTSSSVFPSSWLRPVPLHGNSAARSSEGALGPALSPRWLDPANDSPLTAAQGNAASANRLQLQASCREAVCAALRGNAMKPSPPFSDPYSPKQKQSQSPPGPGQRHHHDLHQRHHFQGQHQPPQRDRSCDLQCSSPEPWAYLFSAATRSPRPQLQPIRAAAGGSEFKSPRPWSSPSPRGLLSSCAVDTISGVVTAKSFAGRQPAGSPPIPAEWLEGIEELLLMLTPRQSSGAELRPDQRLRPGAMASGDVEGRRSPRPRPHSSPAQSPRMVAMAQEFCTAQRFHDHQQTFIQQTQHCGHHLCQEHQCQYHPRNAPEAHAFRYVHDQPAGAQRSPTPSTERGRPESQAPQYGEELRGQGLAKERVRSPGCEHPLRAVSPGRMHPHQQQRSQRTQASWHAAQVQPSTSTGGSTGRMPRRATHTAADSILHGGGEGTSILPWTPPGVAPLGKRRMNPQEEPHAKAQKSPGQPHPLGGQEQAGRGRPRTNQLKCSRARSNSGYNGVKQHQQRQQQAAQERPAGAGDVQYSSFDASASAVAGRLLREAEQVGFAAATPRAVANGDSGVDGALGGSGGGRAVGSQYGRGQGTALRPPHLGGNFRGDGAAGSSGAGGTTADFRPFPVPEWSPAGGAKGASVDCGTIPDASPRLEAVQEFLGRCVGEPGPRNQARGGLNSPHVRDVDTSAPGDLVGIFSSTARRGSQWNCRGSNPTGLKAVLQPGRKPWAANGQQNIQLPQQPEQQQLLPRCTVASMQPVLRQMAQRAFAGWRRQVVMRRLCRRIAHRRGQQLQAHVLRAWEEVVRVQQAHRRGAWATLTSLRLLRLLRKSWLAWRHACADRLHIARVAAAQYVRSLVARAMRGWITRWAQGASVRVLRRHRAAATMRSCLTEWREVAVRLQLDAAEEEALEPQQLEYGRGVHRALRLRNCFRAWLLLADAAVQVRSLRTEHPPWLQRCRLERSSSLCEPGSVGNLRPTIMCPRVECMDVWT
ncbi:hypothetical protein Vafri_403 [Volvox africanus]|nr:hypothetical protein Vafri_403 [Volvox africanus]